VADPEMGVPEIDGCISSERFSISLDGALLQASMSRLKAGGFHGIL
jgi:hypothetical protein